MRLAKFWREWCLIPFLIFGYMETLRRATFQSFGLMVQGYAFTIISLLVVILVVLEHYCRRAWLRYLYGGLVISYLAGVLLFNFKSGTQAGLLWGLPVMRGGNSSGETQLIVLMIFVFYAILLYLVGKYVLERKSITELTLASSLLLSVEIASSKPDISLLVIAHIMFVLLLRSQTFYMHLLSYPEFSNSKREFGKSWVGINIGITTVIVILALIVPTQGKGLSLTSQPVQWVKSKVMTKAGQLTGQGVQVQGEKPCDSFHVYWDRLEKFELTGEVQASDKLVMSIKSARPFYWRGESADFYTGKGWNNSFEMDKINSSLDELSNPYGEGVPVQTLEQTFTIAPDLSSTVIFTANVPQSISIPGNVFWSDEGGNYYTDEMKSGFTYKVVSYIPEVSDKQLQKAKVEAGSWVGQYYLQLPENLPKRVIEKARAITKDFITPYDKARAIERYLSKNYPYSLEIKSPEKNRDIVDYFLFDLKKGYCTYHSTAMVVMLRSIGIPARWVKGFATGTYDAESGTYMVKEGDAHAWVEVYFGDYGWIPFEPTASFQLPAIQAKPASVNEAAVVEETSAARNMILVEEAKNTDNGLSQGGQAVAAALTALMVIHLWRRLRSDRQSLDITNARDYYLDMVYLMEMRGCGRGVNQTPREFADNLCEKFPPVSQEINLLTEGYLREQYGHHNFNQSQFNNMQRAWEKIVALLKEVN